MADTRKTPLELGHQLAGESQAAITEVLEAWQREVRAAALREALSLFPAFKPSADEDVASCSECHRMVAVSDEYEYENGDLCWPCSATALRETHAKLEAMAERAERGE